MLGSDISRNAAPDSLEATMSRLTCLAILALCISLFAPKHLFARDDGRFANSPLKGWFDRLASGKGLCCSFADGVSVEDSDGATQIRCFIPGAGT